MQTQPSPNHRQPPPPITRERIEALVQAGATVPDLCTEFRVGFDVIYSRLKEFGIRVNRRLEISRDELEPLLRSYRTLSEVARELNVSLKTVITHCRELGLPRPPRLAGGESRAAQMRRRCKVCDQVKPLMGGFRPSAQGRIWSKVCLSCLVAPAMRRLGIAPERRLTGPQLEALVRSASTMDDLCRQLGITPRAAQSLCKFVGGVPAALKSDAQLAAEGLRRCRACGGIKPQQTGSPAGKPGKPRPFCLDCQARQILVVQSHASGAGAKPAPVRITKTELERLIASGRSRSQIERELGISNQAIKRLLRDYGLTMATKPERSRQLAEQGLRRCCQCKQIKPLETGFYNHRANWLGKNSRCKDCQRAQRLRYPQQRTNAPPGRPLTRRCHACHRLRLLETDFEPDPNGPRQRALLCRDCSAQRQQRKAARQELDALEAGGRRVCCRCHAIKDLMADFGTEPRCRRGRRHACRECLRQDDARRESPRESGPAAAPSSTRMCERCEKVLPLAAGFPPDPAGPRGYSIHCRECVDYPRATAERPAAETAKEEVIRLESKGVRRCKRCGKLKVLQVSFDPSRQSRGGRTLVCSECLRAAREERAAARHPSRPMTPCETGPPTPDSPRPVDF